MNKKVNPEFLPLIEWWETGGKKTVLVLILILAAWGAWRFYRAHEAQTKTAAANALASAWTTEELEEAVTSFGTREIGPLLKLRLAKSYFDGARYEEALALYEALPGALDEAFKEIPVMGRAQCLEALARYDEALTVYETLAAGAKDAPFTLTAQIGAARCICQKGDKTKALARLSAMKAANKGDELAMLRIEAAESLIKRAKVAETK